MRVSQCTGGASVADGVPVHPGRDLIRVYVEAWRDAEHDLFPPAGPVLGQLGALFKRELDGGATFAELRALAVDMGTRGEYSMRNALERRRRAAAAETEGETPA